MMTATLAMTPTGPKVSVIRSGPFDVRSVVVHQRRHHVAERKIAGRDQQQGDAAPAGRRGRRQQGEAGRENGDDDRIRQDPTQAWIEPLTSNLRGGEQLPLVEPCSRRIAQGLPAPDTSPASSAANDPSGPMHVIFWTVSQSQAEPTSAGHMRSAILIHPEAARRAHQNLLREGERGRCWHGLLLCPARASSWLAVRCRLVPERRHAAQREEERPEFMYQASPSWL